MASLEATTLTKVVLTTVVAAFCSARIGAGSGSPHSLVGTRGRCHRPCSSRRANQGMCSSSAVQICPVGALTSKPFRYSARTWELQRRKSVSPHDGLNANLQIQVKGDRVMRVLPRENEAVNECWISDRDRFSYEGLYSEDRLTSPMVKTDGVWHQVSWQDALTAAAGAIASTVKAQGGNALTVLMGPHSTLEESFLAKQIAAAVGSNSIDHRLRVTDPSLDAGGGIP